MLQSILLRNQIAFQKLLTFLTQLEYLAAVRYSENSDYHRGAREVWKECERHLDKLEYTLEISLRSS